MDFRVLTLILVSTTHKPFADSVDQDQAGQNAQADFGSIMSEKDIFPPRKEFQIANIGLFPPGSDFCSSYSAD